MKTEIKSCPFCGENNIKFTTFDYNESYYQDTSKGAMQCENCDSMGGVILINIEYKDGTIINDYDTIIEECIKNWNKRIEK